MVLKLEPLFMPPPKPLVGTVVNGEPSPRPRFRAAPGPPAGPPPKRLGILLLFSPLGAVRFGGTCLPCAGVGVLTAGGLALTRGSSCTVPWLLKVTRLACDPYEIGRT